MSKKITVLCGDCNTKHVFREHIIKAYGWKYQCRGCRKIMQVEFEE